MLGSTGPSGLLLICPAYILGEPLGQIHGEKEDSYWKLIYKLSLLLAKLDLKVLSLPINIFKKSTIFLEKSQKYQN